ncbi:LegC2/C7 family Dot/Icm T4SS effector [uncultured Legionella sp.]|uniref:LegC2/C7 family Dot/Icm T4SS effector n=1 Tax=uncultured Legionella sp. TaxID=210934 RepID=UPI00262662E9|nr:LegC2/C7 family Dot/Icm T4SS effector [uncultured Legionella sp.]
MSIQETVLQDLLKNEINTPIASDLAAAQTHPLQIEALPEHLYDLSALEESKIDLESLQKITSVKDDLLKVKGTLVGIVDTMANDPSMITRWSKSWGELPLWQKILGGVALSGPTVAAGLFAHVAALMVIGGVTGVAYTASGIILDDHHIHNVNIAQRLKQGVSDLADLLMLTINALEKIAHDLKVEIGKFAIENTKLADSVVELRSEVESLTNQVEVFMKTQELLRETRNDLEKTAESLKNSVVEQTELLNKNQLLLKQVKVDYEKNEQQLSAKIAELLAVKKSMDLEVERAKLVANTLEGTVLSLTGTVIKDGEQRAQFQQNLDLFLKDKEGGFDKVATRICDAEKELEEVKKQLSESTDRYKELLDRQEEQVARLEQLGIENIPPQNYRTSTGIMSSTKALHKNSIYNVKSHCTASVPVVDLVQGTQLMV